LPSSIIRQGQGKQASEENLKDINELTKFSAIRRSVKSTIGFGADWKHYEEAGAPSRADLIGRNTASQGTIAPVSPQEI